MLSGRFADGLIHMYMASAVLKRFEDTGAPAEDQELMEWSVRHCLFQTQIALDQILRNFPSTPIGLVLRGIVFPLGRRYRTPNDKLTRACAKVLMSPSEARDRLTSGLYITQDPSDPTGAIEYAFECVMKAAPAERKIKDSRRKPSYGVSYEDFLQELVTDGVIDADEAKLVSEAASATHTVVMVDDFPTDMAQSGTDQDHLGSYIPNPLAAAAAEQQAKSA